MLSIVLLMTVTAFQPEPVVIVSAPESIAVSAFRGIAVRNSQSAWVGGSNGVVMRTSDGGTKWQRVEIPDSEGLDFRDIAVFNEKTVVLLAAGPGAKSRIYRSTDDGVTWKRTFQNTAEAGFFNAFAFWSDKEGVLVGDPLNGRLDLYRTSDGGITWKPFKQAERPKLNEGEYGFAASGTNLIVQGQNNIMIATGGSHARVLVSADKGKTWAAQSTPMTHGQPSTGIFSVAFRDAMHGIIVGGDYKNPDVDDGNAAWTSDGGKTWNIVKPADGLLHKACVRHLHGKTWLTIGRTGISQSTDDGHTWKSISPESFFTFALSPDGTMGYMAGAKGHVARFEVVGVK